MIRLIDKPLTNVFIYGILDPRDGTISYVGKTSKGMKRLKEHVHDSNLKKNTPKNNFIKKIKSLGLTLEFIILEECNELDLNELERFYISYFRFLGVKLKNQYDGGEGGCFNLLSEESKNELRKKLSHPEKQKKVIDLDSKIVYNSLMDASRSLKLSTGALCDVLNNKTVTINGYFLSYLPKDTIIDEFVLSEKKRRLERLDVYNRKTYLFKKIKCLNNNKIYESIKDASNDLNLKNNSIVSVLKGNRNSIFGYKFIYVC